MTAVDGWAATNASAPMNAVLGMADGYDWPTLEAFVRTLRESGYRDDLVLFGNHISTLLRRKSLEFEVQWMHFDALPYRPEIARYFLYAEHLRNRHYRDVFLTDTRDVVFQGNVFEEIPTGVVFFEEDPSMTVGRCPYNHQWVTGCYGENAIANEAIICSGTIFGKQEDLQAFLRIFIAEVQRLEQQARVLVDQAIVNQLVRTGRIPNCTVLSNDMTLVQTLGYVRAARLVQGRVVNSRGDVVRVLHQYDRSQHAELRKTLCRVCRY